MTDRHRAGDLVIAGYNLLLLAVWAGLRDRAWYAGWIAAAHGMAVALPFLLAWRTRGRALSRPVGLLCEIYPLLLIPLFWSELGRLHAVANPATHDAAIARLDLAFFGRHLNLVWMPAMPYPALSELMHGSYLFYYLQVFLPPLVLALAGRAVPVRDMMLRLTVTYLGCYLLYLAYPVIGPATLMPHYQGPLVDGFFYRLTHAARDAGDALGTAFPSSHVAGATTAAVLAWRWFPRGIAVLVTLQAVGVLLATVYTQNHYAIDAAAGLLWALLLQGLAVPILLLALEPSADRRGPVPVLPASGGFWPEPLTGGGG
jgi:membrane-associated phospholipid phosphatase